MKIVLASPPLEVEVLGPGTPPPLGLFYIAMAAREKLGVEIKIVDACVEGRYAQEAAARVLALEPDIFGISVMSANINRGLKLLRLVKQARPSLTTVLGGLHATLFDRLLLREVPEVDLILRGEAEESFPGGEGRWRGSTGMRRGVRRGRAGRAGTAPAPWAAVTTWRRKCW
ncbi:MAG: cobalamin-dependent protein [Desulfobaccales bacterium]